MTEAKQEAPFTVRWECKIGGISRQRIIEADQVNVAYDDRPPTDAPTTATLGVYAVPEGGGIVVLGNPESGAESLALIFGRVYIMNKDGKTVATYKLADPEQVGEVGEAVASR